LSPQSSVSISSGVSSSLAAGGSSRTGSQDMTSGWLDSLAIHQRLHSGRTLGNDPTTPSPLQAVSPTSLTDSSDGRLSGTNTRIDGHVTPGERQLLGRRAVDIPGASSTIGDAASHATMIMQSRQAKVQRWRPRNVSCCYWRELTGISWHLLHHPTVCPVRWVHLG
jgi:hypothetical protein